MKVIESGERKEISLGYRCELDQTPGELNGQRYDAVQKSIVINHVALGPKGFGRATLIVKNRPAQSATLSGSTNLVVTAEHVLP